MFKKKIIHKVVMISLGLLAGLLFCEVVLQIGSLFVRGEGSLGDLKKPGMIRIACLGDSFTYGFGAPGGQSYPDFLRKHLEQRIKGVDIINCGIPGLNTAGLSMKVEKLVNDLKPDILVVMIGANDSWNITGLFPKGNRAIRFLKKSKLYKLLDLLVFNIRIKSCETVFLKPPLPKRIESIPLAKNLDKMHLKKNISFCILFNRALNYKEKGEFDKTLELVYYMRELGVMNSLVYDIMDNVFIEINDLGGAIAYCLELREMFPEDPDIALRLGRLYKAVQDHEQALKYFNSASSLNPEYSEAKKAAENAVFFISRGLTKKFLGSIENYYRLPAKSFEHTFTYYENRCPVALSWHGNEMFTFSEADFDLLLSVLSFSAILDRKKEAGADEKYIYKLNKEKVKEICRIAKGRNVLLVFLGYPTQVFAYVKEAAEAKNALFYDLRDVFKAEMTPDNIGDYLIPDGHCTALGYELIGQAVSRLVVDRFNSQIKKIQGN